MSRQKLIEKIGEHKISLRTLQRIEQGAQNVRYSNINELEDFFGLELRYKLRDEYEEKIMRDWLLEEDLTVQDCIEQINGHIEEYRTLFHREENRFKKYHITNLAEFLIFYPLMDPERLNEGLFRIGGEFRGRFYYALEQMEIIYKAIPDSELKRVAGELVQSIWDDEFPIDNGMLKEYKRLLG